MTIAWGNVIADIIIRDSNGIEIEIISLNDKIKNNPEKNKLNSV